MDQWSWKRGWPPSLALGWPLARVFRLFWTLQGRSHRPLILASFFLTYALGMWKEGIEGDRWGEGRVGRDGGGGERTAITTVTATPRCAKHLTHMICHHPRGSPILRLKEGAGVGRVTLLRSASCR